MGTARYSAGRREHGVGGSAMQSRILNRRALARYATFWNALLMVGEAVADARRVGNQLRDGGEGEVVQRWHVATGEDITKAGKRADRSLGVLCKAARRWEAELVSREWRV